MDVFGESSMGRLVIVPNCDADSFVHLIPFTEHWPHLEKR